MWRAVAVAGLHQRMDNGVNGVHSATAKMDTDTKDATVTHQALLTGEATAKVQARRWRKIVLNVKIIMVDVNTSV